MRLRSFMMAVTVAAITTAASAQWGRELKPGSDAPKLDIEKWVNGSPVNELEKGNVYLVEFWATWCGPCRAAIPLLNTLQREFEHDGLVVIGVSTDEKLETVEAFVRQQFGQIQYRIAFDKQKATQRAWMDAARINTIPASFLVDREGKIQYIGSPHDENFVLILALVLQGRYNAKLFEEVVPSIAAYQQARRVRNYNLAYRHIDDIINHDRHIFAPFHFEKFEIMMVDRDAPEEAYAYAKEIMEEYRERRDPAILAHLAETIASDPKIKDEYRDLDLAMAAAEAARDVGRANDPEILATLALVHFHKGDVTEAITLQRRAWMIASPLRKPYYERALRNYQDAQQRAARMSRE